jgi:hypothetical protein
MKESQRMRAAPQIVSFSSLNLGVFLLLSQLL